jgi:hypothetical protein
VIIHHLLQVILGIYTVKISKRYALAGTCGVVFIVFFLHHYFQSNKNSHIQANNESQISGSTIPSIFTPEHEFAQTTSLTSLPPKFRALARIKYEQEPYDELITKETEKDGVAAFKLYRLRRYCFDVPKSQTEYNVALSRFNQTRRNEFGKEIVDLDKFVEHKKTQFNLCQSVKNRSQESIYQSLSIAANAGITEAQVETVLYPPPLPINLDKTDYEKLLSNERGKIKEYLNSAMTKGSAEAHYWMAQSLFDGVLLDKDPAQAYVHLRVAYNALQNKSSKKKN